MMMMNITNSEEALRSYCKSKGYEKPVYKIISRSPQILNDQTYRPKYYVCSVSVNARHLANGDGLSKRIARKKAAMYGLQNLRILEMTNFFSAFKDILPQRAIGYHNESDTKFVPSVQIEEMLNLENVYNEIRLPALQNGENNKIKSKEESLNNDDEHDNDNRINVKAETSKNNKLNKEDRRNSDPSEELINAAIAKLRSYDDVIDEIKVHHNNINNNNNDNNNLYENTRTTIEKQSKIKEIIIKQNDLEQKQMQEITKQILDINLENNDQSETIIETLRYIDDTSHSGNIYAKSTPMKIKSIRIKKNENIYKI